MKVKDVMHKSVACAAPDQPISEIANMMRKEDVGAIPVGENDRLIGIVTDRDIVLRGFTNGLVSQKLSARDLMSQPITYFLEEEDIEDAVRLMGNRQIRRLPVINKQKHMVGGQCWRHSSQDRPSALQRDDTSGFGAS